MYVCGPTVYDVPHIGHGRFVLVFDILRRYLEFMGLSVVHVSNITDVDDKIIARAIQEASTPSDVSLRFETIWWQTLDDLNVLRPTHTPHATSYVDQMIHLTSELLGRGSAYHAADGVYFEVSSVADYGLLAHQNLGSLKAGARVETNPNKRSPLDFALWKLTPNAQWAWDSPFGRGRPGWHTECVVMAEDLLGETFDIHGGGADLMFPHHENERAQAAALGHSFANHWVHNGFIVVNDVKMSKSLDNFVTLPELMGDKDPRAYRLLVLQSHYRSPLEVNQELIADATRALMRIDQALTRYRSSQDLSAGSGSGADLPTMEAFRAAMDSDLDTPGAMALLFGSVTRMNSAFDRGDRSQATALGRAILEIVGALGLLVEVGQVTPPDAVVQLFSQREQARAERDFGRSDSLRNAIEVLGWTVEDSRQGGVLKPLNG